MKTLIDKLAAGVSTYEMPDAEVLENRIAVELETGDYKRGELNIKSKNNLPIKGVVFSTDNHITFENNQFNGINNVIRYSVSSKNLEQGQICNGTISMVTTAGGFDIPFAITIKKRELESTIGMIGGFNDFLRLINESYDEALILFLSKEFKEFFLKNDSFGSTLYDMVLHNSNRGIAMEEFLVGMGLKKRVAISTKENYREYSNIKENYADTINLERSCLGYAEINVTVEGDFLYNCKSQVKGDDFNGKVAEYEFYINAARLHGGSNHGRLIFETTNETIVYDIVIVNEKDEINDYIEEKKNNIGLIKNYLDFRTGVIDGKKWINEMSKMAQERLEKNEDDLVGILVKAQVAIAENNTEEATSYLDRASKQMAIKDKNNVEEYCYYLYLKTLHKNNPNYTNEIKAEIKKYFESGHDTWQLLWLLFYMDERYDENPSLKYTMIKRMFGEGCFSPVMYFEAANILINQPELLRILNSFEIQVLNFAAKYKIVTKDLAKQTAELMIKDKAYNEGYFNILARFYEQTKEEEVLTCICTMIINGNKLDHSYSKWLTEGIREELRITNLYEYYIYTINTSNYKPLEKSAYKYFSYGTDTLMYNKDYFYANLLTNISMLEDEYLKFRDGVEKYATEQLLKGNNNDHLRLIYSKLITDDFLVGNMQQAMPQVLNTYKITVKNEKIKTVVVRHKETENIITSTVNNGVAYVRLYTKNPVILFMDNKGRFIWESDYQIKHLKIEAPITKKGSSNLTKLVETEKILEHPNMYKGKVQELKETVEIPELSKQYRDSLKEFIVDYYYKGYDLGEMDIYIMQFNLAELSKVSRKKIMEILIERNLMEMVYPHIAKYGYESIKVSLLEKLCVELVKEPEFDKNEILIEMCAESFRNGCRDENVLKFLGKYYDSGSLELYQMFLAVQSRNINDNTLAEKLLVQLIFEGSVDKSIYEIYEEYIKGPTSSVIRRAFYTYVSYNYFIKKVQCPERVWEIVEQELENGFDVTLITKIAFVEVMSQKDKLTENQIKITKNLIDTLVKSNVNFEFYKKFNKWYKIPFNLLDKTIIDFRTNPKHRVDITYEIKNQEGKTGKVTEEMGSIYPGIFSKEVIMFYGEEIDYSIKEYSNEYPEGKVVDNYSVRISEKNAYNDESRFGIINSMMICKALGEDDAARDMMQTYELCKEAGRKLFRLL